jgi:uncharacterized protein YaiL (DUF2058 family)
MSKSLQDQLLNAGLVNKDQIKKVKSEKRKQRKTNAKVVNESKLTAEQARQEKIARDRELNQQKQKQAEQRAVAAQIKQLIDQNRQPQDQDGAPYHFSDNNHVKTIYISENSREQLSKGKLAIARLNNVYELVPAQIAEKISQRDNSYIVQILDKETDSETTEDDPYADFQVPDDLMW